MNMRSLKFPRNHFDAVWVCASCVHTSEDVLDSQLREFERVLKPGGLLGITLMVDRVPAVELDGRFFEGYNDQGQVKRLVENVGLEILESSTDVTVKTT